MKGNRGYLKSSIAFVLAWLVVLLVHEGFHALMALVYGEFQSISAHWLGPQVNYVTEVASRQGFKWALISGVSTVVGLTIGYILFAKRDRIVNQKSPFVRVLLFWLTILFLLFDPFNISIAPFIVNGDVEGIAMGLGINRWVVQSLFFFILLINREIIISKVFPVFGVTTKHILFHPIPYLSKSITRFLFK